jgi:hypothetical protein
LCHELHEFSRMFFATNCTNLHELFLVFFVVIREIRGYPDSWYRKVQTDFFATNYTNFH